MKLCPECGEIKPWSGFYLQQTGTPRTYCKKCYAKVLYRQGINRSHKEVITKLCSKCSRVKLANEFRKKKDRLDGLATYCNECRNELERAKYKEHPEKQAERQARWSIKHPEEYQTRITETNHRRRAAIKNGEMLTPSDYKAIRERSAGHCPYCGKSLKTLKKHYDHFFPISAMALTRKII